MEKSLQILAVLVNLLLFVTLGTGKSTEITINKTAVAASGVSVSEDGGNSSAVAVAGVSSSITIEKSKSKKKCAANERFVKCPEKICEPQVCSHVGFPQCSKNEKKHDHEKEDKLNDEAGKKDEQCSGPPACICKVGYVRNHGGVCISAKECPSCGGDKNATHGCGINCGRRCSNYDKGPAVCTTECYENSCDCKKDFVFDDYTGHCVKPEDCSLKRPAKSESTTKTPEKGEEKEEKKDNQETDKTTTESSEEPGTTTTEGSEAETTTQTNSSTENPDSSTDKSEEPTEKSGSEATKAEETEHEMTTKKSPDTKEPESTTKSEEEKHTSKGTEKPTEESESETTKAEETEHEITTKKSPETTPKHKKTKKPKSTTKSGETEESKTTKAEENEHKMTTKKSPEPTHKHKKTKKPKCTTKSGESEESEENEHETTTKKSSETTKKHKKTKKPKSTTKSGEEEESKTTKAEENEHKMTTKKSPETTQKHEKTKKPECTTKSGESEENEHETTTKKSSETTKKHKKTKKPKSTTKSGEEEESETTKAEENEHKMTTKKSPETTQKHEKTKKPESTTKSGEEENTSQETEKPTEESEKATEESSDKTTTDDSEDATTESSMAISTKPKGPKYCNGKYEHYNRCASKCPQRTCADYLNGIKCKPHGKHYKCRSECQCLPAYYRSNDGRCLTKKECKREAKSTSEEQGSSATDSENQDLSTSPDPKCVETAYELFLTGNLVYTTKVLLDVALSDPGNNAVVGGASILFMLGQLVVALKVPKVPKDAKVPTLETEIMKALNLKKKEQVLCLLPEISANLTKRYHDIDYDLFCKIYADESYALTHEFIKSTTQIFGIGPENIKFKSYKGAKKINIDVKKYTNNQFRDFVGPRTLRSLDGLVLVDAERFQGKWEKQFNPLETTVKDFYTQGRIEKIDFMHQKGEFFYADVPKLSAKILQMKYIGGKFELTIFLPYTVDGIKEVAEKLQNAKDTLEALNSLKVKNVDVYLPKFKISVANRLKASSELANLNEIFNAETTGLSEIGSAEPPYVSEILQKITYHVDENGMGKKLDVHFRQEKAPHSKLLPKITFKADHPFYFMLTYKSLLPLYAGVFIHL